MQESEGIKEKDFIKEDEVKKKILLMTVLILALVAGEGRCQEKEILSLSLEECLAKALKNNLQVAVEVYNPELADIAVTRAREIFTPRFEMNYGSEHQESPPYWWIQGENNIVTKISDYGISLKQQIPTGGNFSLSLTNYKSDTNQAFQLINPRYESAFRIDFVQPLLKNFGFKVNRQQILQAQNNLEISNNQLQNVILDTLYFVEESYWNLVHAIEDFKVKQQSLELGRDLLAKNKREVELGQIAPIEILNAEAVVASREADLIQAEALITRNEELLKTLINLSAEGGVHLKKIVPSDRPGFQEVDLSLDQALKTAMDLRPDLQIQKKNMESKDLNLKVARNQMLPGLDMQFSYWSPGISGDQLLYKDDNPLSGEIIGREKGNSWDSFRDAFKLLYKNWNVGLTLSIPLSNFLTKAEYAYAQVELNQSLARLKSLEQQVALEISDAVRSVETNAKRVEAYRVARELAEKRLEAEEKKLKVGLSINYFVLEYQDSLANAKSMELKALVDYNLSLARLKKAMGTSLEK
ncbi:MAG: TolC family protein [Candidatus Aminicenantales bacterium]